MLQILPTDSPAALVVRASGAVDAAQNAGLIGTLRRLVAEHGPLSVLLDLDDGVFVHGPALVEGVAFLTETPCPLRTLAVVGTGPQADRVETLARFNSQVTVRRFVDRRLARAFVCQPSPPSPSPAPPLP